MALAHNTEYGTVDGAIPLIIENPELFPFEPGERENEWHEATEAELAAYEDYWNLRD